MSRDRLISVSSYNRAAEFTDALHEGYIIKTGEVFEVDPPRVDVTRFRGLRTSVFIIRITDGVSDFNFFMHSEFDSEGDVFHISFVDSDEWETGDLESSVAYVLDRLDENTMRIWWSPESDSD